VGGVPEHWNSEEYEFEGQSWVQIPAVTGTSCAALVSSCVNVNNTHLMELKENNITMSLPNYLTHNSLSITVFSYYFGQIPASC
jgi:hypothetical protein